MENSVQFLLQALIAGLFLYLRIVFIQRTGDTLKQHVYDLLLTFAFAAFSARIIADPGIAFSSSAVFFLMFLFLFLAINLASISHKRVSMYYRNGGALLYYKGKYNATEMKTHGVSEKEIDDILHTNGISDVSKIKAILLSKGKLVIIKN